MAVRVLHLSDLHLSDDRRVDPVDADASLALVLDACAQLPDIGAVVVTGDIADDGRPGAYRRALAALGAFAQARGAHLMFCPGNHDERSAFRHVLGYGHFGASGAPSGTPGPDSRRCGSSVVGGLRIVTLDSLVEGKWYGHIDSEQLAWLSDVLAADPAVPTVLALHHPPIDLGVRIQRQVRLENAADLERACRSGTVSAILCGHFHQQIAGSLGGVPTWVTPGVFTRIEHLRGPEGTERVVRGGTASVIDFSVQGAPVFATIAALDPSAGTEIASTTADELADVLAIYGLPG